MNTFIFYYLYQRITKGVCLIRLMQNKDNLFEEDKQWSKLSITFPDH